MEKIIEKKLCTGCSACMNICPKNAISLVEDNDGFKYPIIDNNKCIDCGLCRKTCPVLNTNENYALNECYVAYAKDKELKKKASSGGILPLLANFIIEDGIVVGAAFDKEMKLKHFAIQDKKDLDKIFGSKYVQSDLGDIFKYIKEKLNDKKVLFVGTPCQVAGLKAYLKKDYNNLYCVDLFCHGVPSPKLFRKYIEELENKNKEKVIQLNFRDKKTGWDNYSVNVGYENKEHSELYYNNDYMKLFLSTVALRNCCFQCNFKLGNKYSDITLGDFWGVKNYYPEMYDEAGVSAIIINTEKGRELFKKINDNINYKECKLEEISANNYSLVKSRKHLKNRDKLFKNIDKMSINELVDNYYVDINEPNFIQKIVNKIKKR